jgi:hypothetical protein
MAFPYTLKEAAVKLGGHISGAEILCPGPGHSAKDRSLAVKPTAANGGFVVHSHSGDDPIVCRDYVRQKLGLPEFQAQSKERFSLDAMIAAAQMAAADHKPKSKLVATYPYTDANGTLLYEKLRFEPKRFAYRLPDGSYKGPDRRVVYRWPELLKYPSATVFVTEGEKDADRVASLDQCATTVASGKWTEDCVNALADRYCWIIQDCDEPGKKKALIAATALYVIAKSVKIIHLPGLTGEKDNKDVTDWLDKGHTKDELITICTEAVDWHPTDKINETVSAAETVTVVAPATVPAEPATSLKPNAITLSFFSDLVDAKPKPWLIKNVIARGECSSWIAPPGKGKSALLTDIFVHGASGIDWRGYSTRAKFGGIYFALERVDLVRRRMTAHRLRDDLPADLPIAISGQVIDLMHRKSAASIVDAIKAAEDRFGCEVGLLTFDTWAKGIAAGGGDESSAKDQNIALANLRRVLNKANVHIATIGHTGKDESRGERGSNAKLADVDLQVQINGDTIRSANVKKANDQPEGLLTTFRLEPFDFGPDEDGDPFRTFILSCDTTSVGPVTDRALSDRQKLAVEALAEAVLNYGVDPPTAYGLPVGIKSVTTDQWRAEVYRRGILDETAKNPRARFIELRNRLAVMRVIGVRDELVWLAKT